MTTIDELEILYKTLEFQPFLSVDEQTDIQTSCSERDELAKSMYTASSLYNHIRSTWRYIYTVNSTIDSILLGGFKCGTITEISGRGATGKTQFLMTLCASVQRFNTPTRQSQCIFIDTENTYSAVRQQEILAQTKNSKASLQNIFVWKPRSLSELMELLKELPVFLETHKQVQIRSLS